LKIAPVDIIMSVSVCVIFPNLYSLGSYVVLTVKLHTVMPFLSPNQQHQSTEGFKKLKT